MAQPQSAPARSRGRMRTSERVAWIGVIGLAVSSLIQWHPWDHGQEAAADKGIAAAKDVLLVTSINPTEYTMGTDQLEVPLNGKLLKPIPSGREIWAAVRKRVAQDDTGSMQQPGLAYTPVCSVDERALTFDCGQIQLGPDTPEAGSYFVYVGLADSAAEKQLVGIEVEQKSPSPIWSHPAPNGLDTGTTIRVTRPPKSP